MRMGRRADGLKADDPFFFALSYPSLFAVCPGRHPGLCWEVGGGRIEMDTTLHASPPRRDKREDHATGRPGVAGRATCTHQTKQLRHASPISRRQLPARATVVLCCAALCALLVLCCDVAAAPAFCIARLSTGRACLGRRSCFSRHTASFPCSGALSFLASLLACPSLPGCLPGCVFSHRSSGKVRASLPLAASR